MGDETAVTITLLLKNMATTELESFKKSLKDLGSQTRDLLQSELTQALSLGAIFLGLKEAFEATDELEQSQRVLAATAQIANVQLEKLYEVSNNLHDTFFLSATESNNFTTAITRLTVEAGQFNKTQQATIAFLELGAARGFTVEGTARALENAYVGVYRTAQRLIGQNLPNLFKEQATAMGLTVQQLTASERAHILLDAALKAGDTARGSYQKWLETAQGQTQVMNQSINEAQIAFGNALRPVRLLALEGIAFLADKIRDFVGGIQLMAVDTREFFDDLEAFGMKLHAWVFEQLASLQEEITKWSPGLANWMFDLDPEQMRHVATMWRNQATQIIEDAGNDAIAKRDEILKRFNSPPKGADIIPPGGPRATDITPDIRQVIELNREIEKLKAGFRDGKMSAVDFAGGLDEIRTRARNIMKETGSGLSEEAWKGLNGIINTTTADIKNAASGMMALVDTAIQMEEAWNKLINTSIHWKRIISDEIPQALQQMGNVIETTFSALVDHSQKASIAFAAGMLKALAAIISGIGQMLLVQAGQWIAEGIANPFLASIKFAAAAKAAAVAAIAFAVAGTMGGAGANVASGGAGGPAGGGTSSVSSTASQNQVQGDATIFLKGDLWNVVDPAFLDNLAAAIIAARGRNLIFERIP